MANKVKFGISNVCYAVLNTDDNTYGTVSKMPGSVKLSLSSTGEPSTFYADNIAYWVSNAVSGLEGSLENAIITPEFKKAILGFVETSEGFILEKTDQKAKPFALGFQINGDSGNSKYWLYNCTAKTPNVEASTATDSIEPDVDTLEFTCAPNVNGDLKMECPASNAKYDTFLNTVVETVDGKPTQLKKNK